MILDEAHRGHPPIGDSQGPPPRLDLGRERPSL
jgi:hypothetical protein